MCLFFLSNMHLILLFVKDEGAGDISIDSKQRMTLPLKEGFCKKREFSVFERLIRKHSISNDNSLLFIKIQTNEPELGWSGPVCLASLGHFFLKFRNEATTSDNKMTQFAAVHVVEEGSTLVLSFYKPPNLSLLPYRIENCLHSVSITYYQKVYRNSLVWIFIQSFSFSSPPFTSFVKFPGFIRAGGSWACRQRLLCLG